MKIEKISIKDNYLGILCKIFVNLSQKFKIENISEK